MEMKLLPAPATAAYLSGSLLDAVVEQPIRPLEPRPTEIEVELLRRVVQLEGDVDRLRNEIQSFQYFIQREIQDQS